MIEKLETDIEIRNPQLDVPSTSTLVYSTPPEKVITQPTNKEIAQKVNEIIEFLNKQQS